VAIAHNANGGAKAPKKNSPNKAAKKAVDNQTKRHTVKTKPQNR